MQYTAKNFKVNNIVSFTRPYMPTLLLVGRVVSVKRKYVYVHVDKFATLAVDASLCTLVQE